ncbi:MAG: hypothetical protein ACI9ZF_002156 [Bradyrhizobium sp.]|jgi:hypothetical protein
MSGAVKGWWRRRYNSSINRLYCLRYLKVFMQTIGEVILLGPVVASARTHLVP